jgi:hypothetical protein
MIKIRPLTVPFWVAVFSISAGCTTKNPEWLSAPNEAYCASQLDQMCIKDFARQAYTDATATVVSKRKKLATEHKVVSSLPAGPAVAVQVVDTPKIPVSPSIPLSDPGLIKDESQSALAFTSTDQAAVTPVAPSSEKSDNAPRNRDESDAPVPSINVTAKLAPPLHPTGNQAPESLPADSAVDSALLDGSKSITQLAFGAGAVGASTDPSPGYTTTDEETAFKEAGALLNVGAGVVTDDVIDRAKNLPDPVLRAEVLSRLLTLYAQSMSSGQTNSILNALYEISRDDYTNALYVKLPGFLKLGDWERAKALRTTLLELKPNPDAAFSMLAYIASCYTMAGLKQDATSIVVDAVSEGSELSGDDRKLIGMAIEVGKGSYPPLQDFYDFRSDEVRLQAYLTIAVIARQIGNSEVAHRSVADAVRFIQKSSVKIDRQKALQQILTLSPGVI